MVNFFNSFSFVLVDTIQIIFYVVCMLLCLIALIFSKDEFQSLRARVTLFGLLFIFVSLIIRSFYVNIAVNIDLKEIHIQYALVTILYILGLLMVGSIVFVAAFNWVKEKLAQRAKH